MNHIAIMRKSWGLTAKILSGEKTIETRWYKNKSAPWNKIHPSDIIFFKDSGCQVSVKAHVFKVEQYSDLTPEKTKQIISKYSVKDLGTKDIPAEIQSYINGKKYCIIIHLINPQRVHPPFRVDKKGFGMMAAWLCNNP